MIDERSRPRAGKARTPESPDALTISLMGSPASAGLARTFAQQQLYKWGYLHILDDALLITSELVANASEATPGKELRYRIERNAKGVLISVWDSSPRVPTPKPLTEPTLEALDHCEDTFDSGGGWGLPIVQALSAACGYTPHPTGGKWVWARLVP